MKRFVGKPQHTLIWSTICNGAVAIAVFAFAAPPVILLPANLVGVTIYLMLNSRVADRRFGGR